MRVGVPRETQPGEHRVGLVPDALARLEGFTVVLERGAGLAAGYPDEAYAGAGAEIGDDAYAEVDCVVKVASPSDAEIGRLRSGELILAFLAPLTDRARIEPCARRACSASRWSRSRAPPAPRRWTRSPRRQRSPATRRR